jgi:hypothetical protein
MRTIAFAYTFESSSGKGIYTTLEYDNGSLSCDCPGWTRRVQPDGSRDCKHCRYVAMGLGKAQSIRWMDYSNGKNSFDKTMESPKTNVQNKRGAKRHKQAPLNLKRRVITLE